MLVIRGGRVIDPVSGRDETVDVAIAGDRISAIGKDIAAGSDDDVIDASGCIVAPGLMDAHVHFRDPGFTYKEDIETGAAAAKKGGFTTVVCMANTKPVVDNEETLRYVLDKGKKTGIHVLSCATVTKGMQGAELVDMQKLKDAGAAGFTDDGLPIMDEEVLLSAFEEAKRLGLPVSLHEEDPMFIEAPGVNYGEVSKKLGYGGAHHIAEDLMVARDCKIALRTGAMVCIQHICTAVSVEIVRKF